VSSLGGGDECVPRTPPDSSPSAHDDDSVVGKVLEVAVAVEAKMALPRMV